MIRLSNLNMRIKVSLIICLASIVIFIFVESLTFKFVFKRYQTQISELTLNTSQVISDYYGLLLYEKSSEDLKLGLHDFAKIPFVYDAIVFDTRGNIYAEFHKSKDSIIHKAYTCDNKTSCYRDGFVHVTIPIMHNNTVYGKMYVRSFLDKKAIKFDFLQWTLTIIILQILFAIIVIYLFHHFISNPLHYLIEIIRQIISDKKYNRHIEKKRFDEIGQLYDEFNKLLQTITEYSKEKSSTSNELTISNERYKALVNNIPGVVFQFVHNGKWRIEFVGEGVRELTDGLPAEYFLGKDEETISHILSPESQKMLIERISNGIKENKEFESVYNVITKSGRQKWIQVRGRFVYHQDTGITSVDGVLFDQTEKILAQELLKKTEKRYHDLFENLNDAAFLIDIESDLIVETNKEGEKLLGYNREDIVNKLLKNQLCINADSHPFENNTELKDSLNLFDFYAEIKNILGSNIPVHVRSSILSIGEKNHMLCLVRDISERIEYEHNLTIAKEKAEESDRLKSMFLSNMSHEIRTPLNGFMGFSKLLLSSTSIEETESYITIIEDCGKQLLRIIDDILDVSRIETGQMVFNIEQFSLNGLFDEMKQTIDEQLQRANKLETKTVLNKGLFDGNDSIYSDKHRLQQVIFHLASNAVKFTELGEIGISYKPLKNSVIEFCVSDTGIGIDSQKTELVFNRFTQADNSIAVKYGGSGLGLAIAKGIVEKMGGKMWLESEVGKGSKFYFTITSNKNKK